MKKKIKLSVSIQIVLICALIFLSHIIGGKLRDILGQKLRASNTSDIVQKHSKIPHILHYVWLGKNPLPEGVSQVIDSWHKNLPKDWKIMRWDETNCDMNRNGYIQRSMANRQWAYASDVCRMQALYEYGGLYMDTDHLLKSSPEQFLKGKELVVTYEDNQTLSASFIAVSPKSPVIKNMLSFYDHIDKTEITITPKWTSAVSSFYHMVLNGKWLEEDDFLVIPLNYTMINFGGKENIAIHKYDSSAISAEKGYWYSIYKKYFLHQAAIPLCMKGNKKDNYIIPLKSGKGYLYHSKAPVYYQQDGDNLTVKIDKRESIYHKTEKCYMKND